MVNEMLLSERDRHCSGNVWLSNKLPPDLVA